MIKNNGENVIIEFGKGDVQMTPGYSEIDDTRHIGFVLFNNQEPKEINKTFLHNLGSTVEFSDFPVCMTFSKIESIDALISQLELAKKYMIEGIK